MPTRTSRLGSVEISQAGPSDGRSRFEPKDSGGALKGNQLGANQSSVSHVSRHPVEVMVGYGSDFVENILHCG